MAIRITTVDLVLARTLLSDTLRLTRFNILLAGRPSASIDAPTWNIQLDLLAFRRYATRGYGDRAKRGNAPETFGACTLCRYAVFAERVDEALHDSNIRQAVGQGSQVCRDGLGLTKRFRNDESGWTEYDLGGLCFGIQRVDSNDEGGKDLAGRFVGVSLQVENNQTSYQDLHSKGVQFTASPEKQRWGGSLAHFTDPDGNMLTLLG